MRIDFAPIAAAAMLTIATHSVGAQQHQHDPKKTDSVATKGDSAKGHDMAGMKGGMQGGMKHDMSMMKHNMNPWKEMNAFHATLAATYHPAADKNDLSPLRSKARDLAADAKAWGASTAPAACAKPEFKILIDSIVTGSSALAQQVDAGASAESLKTAITSIHGTFERVEMGCGGMKGMHEMKEMKH